MDVIQLKAQLLPGWVRGFATTPPKSPPPPLYLKFPLRSFILSQIPSLRSPEFPALPVLSPTPTPGPPGFVNPYLFIGFLPCVLELSRGDPVWTPIKLCQSGLEELLRECSFSPSQKFLQKSGKTPEHPGQHRDENIPGWYFPSAIKMGGTHSNPKSAGSGSFHGTSMLCSSPRGSKLAKIWFSWFWGLFVWVFRVEIWSWVR